MDRDGSSLLPPGALPCVWMTAGLVSYKLCDREYDCEHCPLDAALRGVELPPDQPADRGETRPVEWEFRPGRRYSPSHCWVLNIGEGRARCGLDVFGAHLLRHVTAVVLPTPESRLQRGRAAFWLQDDAGLIPLKSPVSGPVLSVNRQAQADPGLIATSPYDDGWLLEVRCPDDGKSRKGLLTADQMLQHTARQVTRLEDRIVRSSAQDDAVGPTLPDGGELMTELRKILGPDRYRRIVLSLLSGSSRS
jgi:glycine cleavage system H protein